MEVEYELTIADMKAFFRFHKKHGPKLKPHPWARVILLGFAAVIVAMVLLPSWLTVNPRSKWVAAGFSIGAFAGIVLMVAFLFSLAMLGTSNMLRIYEREECRWLFARRRLKIATDCFEITNELHQLRYDWSVV